PAGEELANARQLARRDADVFQTLRALWAEHADDRLSRVPCGYRGDAQVEVPPLDRDLRAPVLGQQAVRDVELAHDLDAGHDPVERGHGEVHVLTHDAVYAQPNRAPLGPRLDVHVAGAEHHRVPENQIRKL